jgi:hypothetical protein
MIYDIIKMIAGIKKAGGQALTLTKSAAMVAEPVDKQKTIIDKL